MPIVRHKQEKDFTILPNALLRDERLWLRDVGLLARMLSLPDEWSFSVAGLRAIIPGVGRDGLRDSLRRIEAAGYLRREKKRGKDGKIIGEIWTITDDPETALPSPGLPSPGNPTQQSTFSNKIKMERKRDAFHDRKSISGCSDTSTGTSGEDWLSLYST